MDDKIEWMAAPERAAEMSLEMALQWRDAKPILQEILQADCVGIGLYRLWVDHAWKLAVPFRSRRGRPEVVFSAAEVPGKQDPMFRHMFGDS